MVQYKLYYFACRGTAEPIRQIFAVAGQNYEDYRVANDSEWCQLKSSFPFNQMPVLEEDGRQLAQSMAIIRYLARKFGLAGQTPWEMARVDELSDQWNDFMCELIPYAAVRRGFEEGNLAKLKQEVFKPSCCRHLPFFETALKTNGTGYLVGDSLTHVDLRVADFIAHLDGKSQKMIDRYPTLRAHKEKIHSNAELKKWLEARPVTSY